MARKKNLRGIDEEDRQLIEEKMRGSRSNSGSVSPVNYNFKVSIKCKTEKQKEYLNALKSDSYITIAEGPAGTGKSYISLAYALKCFTEGKFDKINIVVPTVEASSMVTGLLPGTLEEKIAPYMAADRETMIKILTDSGNINAAGIVDGLVRNKVINYLIVNYIRGHNVEGAFLINECQNYNRLDLLTLMTRLHVEDGKHSKIILSGDRSQTDRKDIVKDIEKNSGLVYAIKRLSDLPEVDYIQFDKSEIVRHPFLTTLIDRWQMSDEEFAKYKEKQKEDSVKEEPVKEEQKTEVVTEEVVEVPKKKRGRPKKVKEENTEE